ncbi:uncharacterized protein LOC117103289 [Anneissia japonica]|uniref:uncharacterized protein LOC117103289 n=1 Tax=Anneissia japonica TaxID=1529436 RepID=UPI00142553DE|nr:uncharacterized protein LOC117103289 [Anneissia japonica]
MVTKSTGPMDVTCIWDYAGQLDYYITHRFFLTDGSSYGVVFSLFDDLHKMAKPRDSHKVNFFLRVWRAAPWRRSRRSDEEVKHFEMTNLQMILFFIRSIYEHAVLLHGSKETLINGVIASPPISLIGTHKDLLTGTDAEKLTKITDIFKTIFKEI